MIRIRSGRSENEGKAAEMSTQVVLGIDLGTQGVRILAVNPTGSIIASASERLPLPLDQSALPDGWVEQDAHDWWSATVACLRSLAAKLNPAVSVAGIAIDSTSGTIVPLTAAQEPAGMALMYNDVRSAEYVPLVRHAATALEQRLGYAFNASFALPKIVWMRHKRGDISARTMCYIHAADYIVGKLTGVYDVTDYSNALKTGYDLIENRWPSFIADELGISTSQLPKVVAPGQIIGNTTLQAAAETSLASGIPVMAGATDGTAAQLASGAVEPGAWNSSLGTTLVIKGITRELLHDPLHRIYSHRHPAGWWMPGGASNTGCEWIVRDHPDQEPALLDTLAAGHIPTGLLRYPLARTGERFPFINAQAAGFTVGRVATTDAASTVTYAAGLEGTAYIERLAYEVLQRIGAAIGDRIHVTGGGSKSRVWLRIRASVLNRAVVRPHCSETAMGAALLAAAGCWYGALADAAKAMVRPGMSVEPDLTLVNAYDERYKRFCEQLRLRGYLQ